MSKVDKVQSSKYGEKKSVLDWHAAQNNLRGIASSVYLMLISKY